MFRSPRHPAPVRTAILIPARDEAGTLPFLFAEIEAARDAVSDHLRVLVVDNGSTDATAAVARSRGATVIAEPKAGYGRACLAGIGHLAADPPDVLVFMDADDFRAPRQLETLLGPIRRGEADLVVGERTATGGGGVRWHARAGNRFVLWVMARMLGSTVRDMGPFRAIRWAALDGLALDDPDYGWYVQMQVRALRRGLRVTGRAVEFERRTVGTSKVSGDPVASARAGWAMLRTLAVETVRRRG